MGGLFPEVGKVCLCLQTGEIISESSQLVNSNQGDDFELRFSGERKQFVSNDQT